MSDRKHVNYVIANIIFLWVIGLVGAGVVYLAAVIVKALGAGFMFIFLGAILMTWLGYLTAVTPYDSPWNSFKNQWKRR